MTPSFPLVTTATFHPANSQAINGARESEAEGREGGKGVCGAGNAPPTQLGVKLLQ